MTEPLNPPERFEQVLLKHRSKRGQQQAARRIAKAEGINYTTALRRVRKEAENGHQQEGSGEPQE